MKINTIYVYHKGDATPKRILSQFVTIAGRPLRSLIATAAPVFTEREMNHDPIKPDYVLHC